MNSNGRRKGSVTKPLLKDLVDRDKANSQLNKQDPTVGSAPIDPPALYEDSGEAYNADLTFPQH